MINITVKAGYYGWVNEDGMNNCAIPEQILVEEADGESWSVTDITTSANDPQDGERIWAVSVPRQALVDAIAAHPWCEIL